MSDKVTAIIQARMSSSRLPGKVLHEIAGEPMLAHVVERVRLAKAVDQVVVATTADASDDAVEALCVQRGVPCYRGSQHDVLDRFYQAARQFGGKVVVRVTADCPLIDPELVDEAVEALVEGNGWDFVANRLPPPWKRTYPIGLDVEVCWFSALKRAWEEAGETYQREHVMPYLYEDSPVVDSLTRQSSPPPTPAGREAHSFRVLLLNHEPDYGSLRWTVDTAEDLELVRAIFSHFPGRRDFSWLEVIALFQQHPELGQMNASVLHKSYRDTDERGRQE